MYDLNEIETLPSLMDTYARAPIAVIKGKGSYVWDDKDCSYLDFTSGIATCNLGHVPDAVAEKVHEQLDAVWHCSNLYTIPNQEKLAEKLVQCSVFDQVFFANSGAEANEAAIKIAKKYANDHGYQNRKTVVTFSNAFHGRTMTTLTATAQEKIHKGFYPLAPGFRYLTYNDEAALDQINDGKTIAVLLELVQGEGGVHPADKEWVKKLSKICQEADILLMVDEVQTGMGRTGTLFAYEQYGIEPDVMTLAKGLGSGFPIGAMLAKSHVSVSFTPGSHGTTFGGNPLATAAGLATVEEMTAPNFLMDVQEKADVLKAGLDKLTGSFQSVKAVRAMGMLMGLELTGEAKEIIEGLRAQQVLALSAGPKVLRILPPLTAKKEEIDLFLEKLTSVLEQIESQQTIAAE